MAYNKIIYGGNTLIDLTGDNVTAADVRGGVQFTGPDGEHSLGNMPERGAVTGTISTRDGVYTIPAGHHNGSGTCQISAVERNKILPENIKLGCTLLGIQGSYAGETPTLQTITKSYTPSASAQSEQITAGSGYDAIEKVTVTVAAIPYAETANQYGTTVTIG